MGSAGDEHGGGKREQRQRWRADADGEDVTASEVAAYAYCAKAWHLERVLTTTAVVSTEAAQRRTTGVERHAAHGAHVARVRMMAPVLGWTIGVLLALALLLAGLALAVGR